MNKKCFEPIVIDAQSNTFSIEHNKYLRPILMAYYMTTRSVPYTQAASFFRDFEYVTPEIDSLIIEYISYIKGETITDGIIDNSKLTLHAPKYKASMIESQLEMKLAAA